MERPRHRLQEELAIRELITFYYKEQPRHYRSTVQRHNFWEFVYLDQGEMEIYIDAATHRISQGDLIFYKPNALHAGRALKDTTPTLIIVSFECDAPCMSFFEDKCFRLQEEERQLLSRIVQEGLHTYDPPIDWPQLYGFPHKRKEAPFGSEQLIRNYLENLLIGLIRKGESVSKDREPTSVGKGKQEDELVSALIEYFQHNLARSLTFNELCEEFAVSRTRLKMLFRRKTGCGAMEYFNRLKIKQAKHIMREESASLSEIAERLGYSSIHHFSKQFKRKTNMSPSEYARSINARPRERMD